MCNNAPVVRDILKHWRRKANYTAADSRPRWTRLPWTAPVEWNRLPVGKALLFDTQLRAPAVFYRLFVRPVRRSATADSGGLIAEDGAPAAGTISVVSAVYCTPLRWEVPVLQMFHDVQMGGLQGVLTSLHPPHRRRPPSSAGFPQLGPCTWQLIHNKQRDVRMHIFR